MRRAAVAIVLAVGGCGGEEAKLAVVPVPSAPGARSAREVCHVPKLDVCVEFDGQNPTANADACSHFPSATLQPTGSCAKELRIASCRVEKDGLTAIYFGGDVNDIHDSKEHCEAALHGAFMPTPTKDITATWLQTELTGGLADFTMLMPPHAQQSRVGKSRWLALELYTGYFGIMVERGTMSIDEEKKHAREGSEYFAFDSFVTDTPTKIVWKVKATKGGDVGYKFMLQVSASGTDFMCEALTVFDNLELAEANIESCTSIAKR